MGAMRAPESRTVLMSVIFVGIGSITGAFLDRLSFPHVAQLFNTCASSKQFVVEFRNGTNYWEAYWPGTGIQNGIVEPKLDVDGIQLGAFADAPARRFLCEGNHTVHVRYPGTDGEPEIHTVDFAVSRPSIFHVSQSQADERKDADCNSAVPCTSMVRLILSPYEPDDLKMRIYPPEKQ
jgi:hypothetical protein